MDEKQRTEGTRIHAASARRSMRRLILYAMLFCVLLFLIVSTAGLISLSNRYYSEFAQNQSVLLESYYVNFLNF